MTVMDLPIRPVEVDRAVQAAASRRTRGERQGQAFELDPDVGEHHERPDEHPNEQDGAPQRRAPGDQRIAPPSNDDVGSHLDITA